MTNIETLASVLVNLFALCEVVGKHDGTYNAENEDRAMRAGSQLVAVLVEHGERGEVLAGKLSYTIQCALAGAKIEARGDGSEQAEDFAALVQQMHDVATRLRGRLLDLGLDVFMPKPTEEKP